MLLTMPFELFTREVAAASGPPTVAIQKKGIFAFNRAAYAALGEPRAVALLFDRERQIVGFRAADPQDEDSQLVRPNAKGNSYLVTGTLFTRHYGIDTRVGRRWAAHLEDDLLCINISEPPLNSDARVVSVARTSLPPPSQGGRTRNPGRGST